MVRFTSLKGSDRTITLLARAGPTVGAPVPYLGGDSTEGRTATPRPELMSSLPDLICSVDVEYRSSSLSRHVRSLLTRALGLKPQSLTQ